MKMMGIENSHRRRELYKIMLQRAYTFNSRQTQMGSNDKRVLICLVGTKIKNEQIQPTTIKRDHWTTTRSAKNSDSEKQTRNAC